MSRSSRPSTPMTEKAVKATASTWADSPYQLITTPYTYKDIESHKCVHAASTMASIHNMLIRGLNSMVQQGPQIAPSESATYNEQDVRDFCRYIEVWTTGLQHHHHIEETILFPRWEELFAAPGLLTCAEEEHEAFHSGLVKLAAEAKRLQTVPSEFRWGALKAIIDDFAPALVFHLTQEIELILGFDKFDSALLWKGWMEAENVAKNDGGFAALYEFIPWLLAHSDATYEGGNTFPDMPKPLVWAVRLYTGRQHKNVWRFSPCGLDSKPRPLPFAGPKA